MPSKTAKKYALNGVPVSLSEVARAYGIDRKTLRKRLSSGLTLEESLKPPAVPHRITLTDAEVIALDKDIRWYAYIYCARNNQRKHYPDCVQFMWVRVMTMLQKAFDRTRNVHPRYFVQRYLMRFAWNYFSSIHLMQWPDGSGYVEPAQVSMEKYTAEMNWRLRGKPSRTYSVQLA